MLQPAIRVHLFSPPSLRCDSYSRLLGFIPTYSLSDCFSIGCRPIARYLLANSSWCHQILLPRSHSSSHSQRKLVRSDHQSVTSFKTQLTSNYRLNYQFIGHCQTRTAIHIVASSCARRGPRARSRVIHAIVCQNGGIDSQRARHVHRAGRRCALHDWPGYICH